MEADFYSDMEQAQKIMQNIKQLKDKVERFKKLYGDWEDLVTLVSLGNEMEDLSVLDEVKSGFEAFTEKFETLKLETLLSGQYDKKCFKL